MRIGAAPAPTATLIALAAAGRDPADLTLPTVGKQQPAGPTPTPTPSPTGSATAPASGSAAAPAGIAVSRGALTVSADGTAAANGTTPTSAPTATATTTTSTDAAPAGSTTSTTPTSTTTDAGAAGAGGTVQANGQAGGNSATGSHEQGWAEWALGGLASTARKADQVGGRALAYALTLGGDAGDSASLVDIVYTGDMGVIQGAANTANGVQDVAIGTGNLIGKGVNAIAGYPVVAERASPDWSRGLVVAESNATHNVSKFLGGNGLITALTGGLGGGSSLGFSVPTLALEAIPAAESAELALLLGTRVVTVPTGAMTALVGGGAPVLMTAANPTEGTSPAPEEGNAATSGVVVKPSKFDYFFGRVTSNKHNQDRSLQNLKDLETLGIKEAEGGQAKLLQIFEEGLQQPEVSRITTEYGVTITRTVKVGDAGAIDVKYFYPGGDLSATPEISTIIPKIFKK